MKYFEPFIMGSIICNTFLLILKWNGEPEEVTILRNYGNYLLGTLFIVEAIIKIIAFRFKYFSDGWNVFDFIVVCGTIIGFFFTRLTSFQFGFATTMVRSFRIFRVVRLVKRAKSLRIMFSTIVYTLPAMANIGALLALTVYIYSILGVTLFAEVKFNGALDKYANFKTLR